MYFGIAEILSLQITKKIGSAKRKSAKCHKYANLTNCISPQTCGFALCKTVWCAHMILYPLHCTHYKEGFGSSVLKLSY